MAKPKPPAPLATLTAEQVAALKSALAHAREMAAQADRLRMRLEGAKATMLDAEDAFRAVWHPICAAHGIDPAAAVQLHDDGTLVPAE